MGEVAGMRASFGHELVLQVVQHVSVLAVKLCQPPVASDNVHRLADEVVRAHSVLAGLVGHEHLVRRDAHVEGFGETLQDVGLLVQDEVKCVVQHRRRLSLFLDPSYGVGDRLTVEVVVYTEHYQARDA